MLFYNDRVEISMFVLPFPTLNPTAFSLGPFDIKWYALAYITGILLGLKYIKWLLSKNHTPLITPKAYDDFVGWAVLGIILGGRLGYVLFYDPLTYLMHPLDIIKTWEGGMSFHGAVLGLFLVGVFYTRKHKLSLLSFYDYITMAAPIGLFLGRLTNFINGELYGKVTDLPWAVRFPYGGYAPRHPSQLYEAFCEGILLFFILLYLGHDRKFLHTPGKTGGAFVFFYGLFRFLIEFVRAPEQSGGYIFEPFNLAHLLSLPMLGIGFYFMTRKPNSHNRSPTKIS